jgi:hypothetical protein
VDRREQSGPGEREEGREQEMPSKGRGREDGVGGKENNLARTVLEVLLEHVQIP